MASCGTQDVACLLENVAELRRMYCLRYRTTPIIIHLAHHCMRVKFLSKIAAIHGVKRLSQVGKHFQRNCISGTLTTTSPCRSIFLTTPYSEDHTGHPILERSSSLKRAFIFPLICRHSCFYEFSYSIRCTCNFREQAIDLLNFYFVHFAH